MNALQKAKILGIDQLDTTTIVNILKTITLYPINLAYLMEMLNFRGMLRKTDGSAGQERWVGTLQNLKSVLISLGMTDKVSAYEMWFSHVTNPRQVNWDTSKPEFAVAFFEMQIAFADGEGMPSHDDFNAVVSLGGGRPYLNLTNIQYEDLVIVFENDQIANRLKQEQDARVATIMNDYINPNINDLARLINGLKNAVDYLESL